MLGLLPEGVLAEAEAAAATGAEYSFRPGGGGGIEVVARAAEPMPVEAAIEVESELPEGTELLAAGLARTFLQVLWPYLCVCAVCVYTCRFAEGEDHEDEDVRSYATALAQVEAMSSELDWLVSLLQEGGGAAANDSPSGMHEAREQESGGSISVDGCTMAAGLFVALLRRYFEATAGLELETEPEPEPVEGNGGGGVGRQFDQLRIGVLLDGLGSRLGVDRLLGAGGGQTGLAQILPLVELMLNRSCGQPGGGGGGGVAVLEPPLPPDGVVDTLHLCLVLLALLFAEPVDGGDGGVADVDWSCAVPVGGGGGGSRPLIVVVERLIRHMEEVSGEGQRPPIWSYGAELQELATVARMRMLSALGRPSGNPPREDAGGTQPGGVPAGLYSTSGVGGAGAAGEAAQLVLRWSWLGPAAELAANSRLLEAVKDMLSPLVPIRTAGCL